MKKVFVFLYLSMTLCMAVSDDTRVVVPAAGSCHGREFSFTQRLLEDKGEYSVHEILFPSPMETALEANNTVPAELYLPAGIKAGQRFPGVVCMHILHHNFDLERLISSNIARAGAVVLFFKQPYYVERGGDKGKGHLLSSADIFIEALEQGEEDARRAVDILQSLEYVNPGKIGITGVSMGAIQSASIVGREPRIGKAYITLGGGGLAEIIETAHETRHIRGFINNLGAADKARVRAALDRHDPLSSAAALRALAERGGLRMTCAEEDEVIPRSSSIALAKAAGFEERITWLPGMGHYTAMANVSGIVGDIARFFGEDAPADWSPPEAGGEKSALALVGGFLGELARMLGEEPVESSAHYAGIMLETDLGGKEMAAAFDLVRGGGGRFKLYGDFPWVGKAGFGKGAYPWLSGVGGKVFCGVEGAAGGGEITRLMQAQRLLRFQVGVGMLQGLALSPEIFEAYAKVDEEREGDDRRRVILNLKYKRMTGRLAVLFAGEAPAEISWDVGGSKGRVAITHWRLNSASDESEFEPPKDLVRQEVDRGHVLQMFASLFEYVLEITE